MQRDVGRLISGAFDVNCDVKWVRLALAWLTLNSVLFWEGYALAGMVAL